jgi:hypothetical protein
MACDIYLNCFNKEEGKKPQMNDNMTQIKRREINM